MSDRELFSLLLEQPDAASRRRLCTSLCANDPDRAERLDRLLTAHDRAGAFLEGAHDDIAPTLLQIPDPSAALPCQVGSGSILAHRYTLRHPIGRGGMGVVWIADQSEPVGRQVAVKLIRPDLDSDATFARFAAERQTLAMMDHPNIAKIFDGGTTDDGRPFVVMELVEGVPITRYCDESCLDLDQRLDLFMTVCRAIHHAHQKGIIHRDIKPSNVIITMRDGAPVPKIIDFGVAKTTLGRLDALDSNTGHGDVIGTPQYWSPEQAGLNPHDIDTRSDIYGLGLLLYEMLTGRPPFSVVGTGAMGIFELVRAIREIDPERPSGTAPDAGIAAARRTTPERLVRRLRGDLDWIAMKCLDKDRNRRYESADALAVDLRRYLTDEPVAAGPPTASYRLRKFARKRRRPLAVAAALLLLLVIGAIGTTVGMLRAARAESEAREHERQARARFVLAQDAVNAYLAAIVEDDELKRSDHFELRLRLLASAIPFYQKLAAEQPGDPDQMLAQAVAYSRHADLAREMGESESAIASLQHAESILEQLPPAQSSAMLELARVKRRLADHAVDRGEHAAARRGYHAAIDILEQQFAATPANRDVRLELARTCNNLGLHLGQDHDPQAQVQFERAVQWLDAPDVRLKTSRDARELRSICLNNLGNDLIESERYAEARGHLERALELAQQLAEEDPHSPELVQKRAGLQANLARVWEAQGDRVAARRGMEAAADSMRMLAERFPRHADYRLQWAGVENNAAMLQTETGDPAGALLRHDQVLLKLAENPPPQHGLFSDTLSNAHAGRAAALHTLKRDAEAAEAWRDSVREAPKTIRSLRQSNYAVQLARIDDAPAVRAIAAELENDPSRLVLYNLACACAILHRKHGTDADADTAMRLLSAAVKSGYTQRRAIDNDPDLESLRQREDYQLLMGRIMPEAIDASRPGTTKS